MFKDILSHRHPSTIAPAHHVVVLTKSMQGSSHNLLALAGGLQAAASIAVPMGISSEWSLEVAVVKALGAACV